MTFHGGDLDYGDGYWNCDSCDYSFTEDDMNNRIKNSPFGENREGYFNGILQQCATYAKSYAKML